MRVFWLHIKHTYILVICSINVNKCEKNFFPHLFLPRPWFSYSFTTRTFTHVDKRLCNMAEHTHIHCWRVRAHEQTHCTHTSSLVCIVRIPGMFTAQTHNSIPQLPLISLCHTQTHIQKLLRCEDLARSSCLTSLKRLLKQHPLSDGTGSK